MEIATKIPNSLLNNTLNSPEGLWVTYDKPLGSTDYHLNMERPAVLRQHFGCCVHNRPDRIHSYGSGSGAITVGTHPSHQIPRLMTSQMRIISNMINKLIVDLHDKRAIPPTRILPFNHCSILFYCHKTPNTSSPKMLGFHTDNVYSSEGRFNVSKNTQMENTPTCVLTIGNTRNLHFQKQCNYKGIKSGRRKWSQIHLTQIPLTHNSLFLLNPEDERPSPFVGKIKTRWRHGIPKFQDSEAFSIAIVFRTVTTSSLGKTTQKHDTQSFTSKGDMERSQIVLDRIKNIWSRDSFFSTNR
jgi:hypothetical protein